MDTACGDTYRPRVVGHANQARPMAQQHDEHLKRHQRVDESGRWLKGRLRRFPTLSIQGKMRAAALLIRKSSRNCSTVSRGLVCSRRSAHARFLATRHRRWKTSPVTAVTFGHSSREHAQSKQSTDRGKKRKEGEDGGDHGLSNGVSHVQNGQVGAEMWGWASGGMEGRPWSKLYK